MSEFQWELLPCDPSDLVYFQRRIGETGVVVILVATARLHGKSRGSEVAVDTTAQDKSNTCPATPTHTAKIIVRSCREADRHEVKLRRRYGREMRRCVLVQRCRKDPRNRKLAHTARRKLRTLAVRPVRELERKYPMEGLAVRRENVALYAGCLAKGRRTVLKFTRCTIRMLTAMPRARSTSSAINSTSCAPPPLGTFVNGRAIPLLFGSASINFSASPSNSLYRRDMENLS